uniref:DNA-directed RNA polymerase subunit beta n=1 Tax=Rhizophora mucronata TaxID=61149 RepID=A0A2P2MN90_RHIMU
MFIIRGELHYILAVRVAIPLSLVELHVEQDVVTSLVNPPVASYPLSFIAVAFEHH